MLPVYEMNRFVAILIAIFRDDAWPRMRAFVAVLLVSNVLAGALVPAAAQLNDSEMLPSLNPVKLIQPGQHRKLQPVEKQTLEDVFRKSDLKGITNAPPIDLSSSAIPGLSEKGVFQLAMNYFVVVNGTSYKKISDIYTENREQGKPNFVTVDSIMHPYWAFANGMLASAIEEYVFEDLQELLGAMVDSSIADYRRAEDEEVKDDIQRNLAYLCVALRILDPLAVLPDIGGAIELVEADHSLIVNGKQGRSRIFNVDEDFATFRAWGFMSGRPRLKRFFTAYQWLSRMQFPLSNSSNNTLEGGGNSFRRAALLYHSLVLADVGREQPLERWNRIALLMAMTGFDTNARKKTIIAPELAPVLKSSDSDFNRLLHSLAQPFTRTKLLLSVRNQKPLELNARSVFELSSAGSTAGDDVVFRFFPLIDPPELSWLREEAYDYVESGEGPSRVPLGLITLHAHGAQPATNLLSEQLSSLDIGLSRRVPRLERLVRPQTVEEAASDRHWGIISNLYRPYPDTVQIGLRSELWLTRGLEAAMAAWIDSYSACLIIPPTAKPPASPPTRPSASHPPGGVAPASSAVAVNGDSKPASAPASDSSPAAPAAPSKQEKPMRAPRFHYLEPRVEIYKNLQLDCQNLVKQLTELGYMPQQYRPRSDDFLRLLKRLQAISELEIANEPLGMSDFHLLANIDRVLAPVDCPLSSYIYLNARKGAEDKSFDKDQAARVDDRADTSGMKGRKVSTARRTGVTMGVGRAGKLYIICSTSRGAMLARGGCYTYYEIPDGPQKDEHWERKLTYGLLTPPYWTRKFTIVQDISGDKKINNIQEQSPRRSSAPKQL